MGRVLVGGAEGAIQGTVRGESGGMGGAFRRASVSPARKVRGQPWTMPVRRAAGARAGDTAGDSGEV